VVLSTKLPVILSTKFLVVLSTKFVVILTTKCLLYAFCLYILLCLLLAHCLSDAFTHLRSAYQCHFIQHSVSSRHSYGSLYNSTCISPACLDLVIGRKQEDGNLRC
jgi:hypothetical protein